MNHQDDKKDFTKWLETLQQESWQLELIISGFAIFLLVGAYEPMNDWHYELKKIRTLKFAYSFHFMDMGLRTIRFVWHILFINLLVHVFLRGLWISTIGLRYVSGDIAFEKLKLSGQFNQFLRKRIGSFDNYIERLEKACSVIFAFTFLLFFIALSFLFVSIFIIGITEIIRHFSSFDYQELFYLLHLPFLIFAGMPLSVLLIHPCYF